MKKSAMWGVVGCFLLCLSACSQGGPTVPSNVLAAKNQPAATTGVLVVSSSRYGYFIGQTETFTASLTGPGGGVVTGGTWSSDAPGVATVNEAGSVTVVGQGFANISCAYGGATGSKNIWGRVDCRGVWSGTYSIENCQSWGDFLSSGFCETQKGSGFPVGLVLTGEGDTWDSLHGTITLGNLSTPCLALPLLDGSLEMEGHVISAPYTVEVAIGCDQTGDGPKFCMYLYYTGGGLSGRAQLQCRISLSKIGD